MVEPQCFADPPYALGNDVREMGRLRRQAAVHAPGSDHLLSRAGIDVGMHVLDLGTGVGDVAFLLADRVGPRGRVVGVDRDPAALETARARARELELDNVEFHVASISELPAIPEIAGSPYDAVVGRFVLCHLPNPVPAVETASRLVRPGGIVSFQEQTLSSIRSSPTIAAYDEAKNAVISAFRSAGIGPETGDELPGVFRAAGLDPVGAHGVQTVVTDPEDPTLEFVAASVHLVLSQIGGEPVDFESFLDRLRSGMIEQGACLMLPLVVGAWATRDGAQRDRLAHASGTEGAAAESDRPFPVIAERGVPDPR